LRPQLRAIFLFQDDPPLSLPPKEGQLYFIFPFLFPLLFTLSGDINASIFTVMAPLFFGCRARLFSTSWGNPFFSQAPVFDASSLLSYRFARMKGSDSLAFFKLSKSIESNPSTPIPLSALLFNQIGGLPSFSPFSCVHVFFFFKDSSIKRIPVLFFDRTLLVGPLLLALSRRNSPGVYRKESSIFLLLFFSVPVVFF